MEGVEEYWENKDISKLYFCPNLSLFRFLSKLSFYPNNKEVLEIGFNSGADLLEFKRRGANVYGLDLNPLVVSNINLEDKSRVKVCKCGKEPIPFKASFDLIYSRDTIYYFSDKEIEFFLNDSSKKLNNNGLIIIQFIETDLRIKKCQFEDDINFQLLNNGIREPLFPSDHPIRFLKSKDLINIARNSNLKLLASKRLIQSYDLYEERFRVDRYLAFKLKQYS